MYYKIKQEQDPTHGYISATNNRGGFSMIMGNVLPKEFVSKMILPWTFNLDPGFEELNLSDYNTGVMLLSKKLVETIQSVGVDNLELFEAEVTNEKTGEKEGDFYAVNVVGLVSCVAEDQSTSTPLADVEYIYDLVIDSSRTKGFNMFRLAETRIDILVSEKVADAIKAGNFKGVELQPVKEI